MLEAKGKDYYNNNIKFEYYTDPYEPRENVKKLTCNHKDLVELHIPKGVDVVRCYWNHLTELKVPEGVVELDCCDNHLTELTLPSTIKILKCDNTVHINNIDRFDHHDIDFELFETRT